jgi:hypothetical protein
VAPEVNWVLVLLQLPSEPSRYRVAVWRQLRRAGAVPLSPGVWALPSGPAFEADLDRAAELSREANGTFALIDASPRDEASSALIRDAFKSVRVEEWAEFLADCGKFEREIAHEIQKHKFTFAELEEEEQSLARLRRWYRDLKKRDVLELPEAQAAQERLRTCTASLDDYAERVYAAAQGPTPPDAAGPGQAPRATDAPEG